VVLLTNGLRVFQDVVRVRADVTPHNVHLTLSLGRTMMKRGSAIVGSGHFAESAMALDTLDAQSWPDACTRGKIPAELDRRLAKRGALLW
jgi:hypothetical protein